MKIISTATLILLSTLSYAQVPNTFSSGETISSSQINANFSFLADAMARGNVTAIMICNGLGKVDMNNPNISSGDEYEDYNNAFVNCLASDNTTFHTDHKVCKFANMMSNTTCDDVNWTNTPFITWQETIDNKWFLHLTDRTSSGSNSNYIWGGIYYFYKISDQ